MHMIIYSLFWDDESFVYKQPQYVYMFIYICIYLKMYIYICVYVCIYEVLSTWPRSPVLLYWPQQIKKHLQAFKKLCVCVHLGIGAQARCGRGGQHYLEATCGPNPN
jgi:hypothetical protein